MVKIFYMDIINCFLNKITVFFLVICILFLIKEAFFVYCSFYAGTEFKRTKKEQILIASSIAYIITFLI